MAHLPNPIFYAAGHSKSFYYRWEGQMSQMGERQCRWTGEKKNMISLVYKTCSNGTGISLASRCEHILIHKVKDFDVN